MAATVTDTTPRAWIGCLAYYNEGRLVGDWYDAINAAINAAAWGNALVEVDGHLRPALITWVESGDYVAKGNSDLPCIPDFMERYYGEWSDFAD